MPALPFIFLTQELHVFSATMLEQGQLPGDQQLTKLFSSSDVEALREEFLQVRDMGQGTAGEWLKGLPSRGKDLQQDASKWEKWECSGGVAKMRSQLYPGYARKPPALETSAGLLVALSNPPTSTAPHQPSSLGRHERTAGEVAELKAARKAEIERRALLLDPPLTANVLRHIPSFQAATHIVAPLDDSAWELLKPRLLAQRADAEAREAEIAADAELNQERHDHGHLETTLASAKEAKDRVDSAWEEAQAPLRARIAGYADEVIRDAWDEGKKVTRENCSRFAVDVLVAVRKRFYFEVAKDTAVAIAAGKTPPTDPPEGPFTRKLTLENMKWLFETKVKPHTEPLRKDLFYCSGCDGRSKTYGFEAVIQHYAAKHTDALSVENVGVHWRAEWPDPPLFTSKNRPAKPPLLLSGPARPLGAGPPFQASYNYTPAATGAVPTPTYPPGMGFGYGAPTYHDHYQQHPPLPLPLPPPPVHHYQPQLPVPSFAPQPSYNPQPSYGPPTASPLYPSPAGPYPPQAVGPAHGYVTPQSGQYDYTHGPYQAINSSGAYGPPQAAAYPDLYRIKLEDVARNAREIWRLLGNIKELPGGARVFVTLHHLVKRFRSRFYETPPLTMFIDGLSNHKEMRPVRSVNGLVCKACHLGLGNAASVKQDKKDFSLPQLVNHFQSKHVEQMLAQNMSPHLDWTVDMVLLPDLSSLPGLVSSVNEVQKNLLTAALPFVPFAFEPPPGSAPTYPDEPKRQSGPVSDVGYGREPQLPAGAASHAAGRGRVAAGFIADSRGSAQSSNNGTPAALSESESGRHSSQGSRPDRGQNGSRPQRKDHDRNKPGRTQVSIGSSDRVIKKEPETGGETAWRDKPDAQVTQVTDQAEGQHARPSSAQLRHKGAVGNPGARATTQPPVPSSQHSGRDRPSWNRPASPAGTQEEPDLLAALESRLQQRRDSPSPGRNGASSRARYADNGGSAVPPDYHYAAEAHNRHGEVERREEWYSRDVAEHLPRHAEEATRFSRPPHVYPDERNRHQDALGAERYRFRESPTAAARMHSRPPPPPPPPPAAVETYEIVQVIDEHGEYYIRRPARHHGRQSDAAARYVYEECGPVVHREPVYDYAPVSVQARQSLVRDAGSARGASMAPEGWTAAAAAADRRVDPKYYEEYDPRFPAG